MLHLWEKIFVKDVSDKRLAVKNIQRMFQNSAVKKNKSIKKWAKELESSSNMMCMCVCVCVCESLSPVQLFATPWTVACQAPLSTGFTRQEYWSGLPFPSPDDIQMANKHMKICFTSCHQGNAN